MSICIKMPHQMFVHLWIHVKMQEHLNEQSQNGINFDVFFKNLKERVTVIVH